MSEYALGTMAVSLFALICLRVPIALSLGTSSLIYLWMTDTPITIMSQFFFTYLDSFTLIAIPLFMIAGELMNRSGVSEKLVKFANSFMGTVPGGLAHVNIGTSVLMAGMSGSSSADAATTSMVLVPQMEKEGYPRAFAAAVTAASATIGPVIPPSIHLVLIGGINELPITELLIAGVIPGICMAGVMVLYVCAIAKRRNFPRSTKFSWSNFLRCTKECALSLLAPVIIVGGMVGGLFTPTEAAISAALYFLFLGTIVYGKITFRGFCDACLSSLTVSANIMLIVGFAGVFGWILIAEDTTTKFVLWAQAFTSSPIVLLMVLNVLLLILGCFLSTTSIIVLLSPIVFPLIAEYGINPIHFSIVMMLNLEIGQLTPPVGITSFIVLDVTKSDVAEFFKEILPFVGVLIANLLLATYCPPIVYFLPNLIFH